MRLQKALAAWEDLAIEQIFAQPTEHLRPYLLHGPDLDML
jgi:hypothetical protein